MGIYYLNTDLHVLVETIALGTATFVTPKCVDASDIATWRIEAFVLVDALIEVQVLYVSIWTATAETAHEILKQTRVNKCVQFRYIAPGQRT